MPDNDPIRVLFVCLGNICRSPLAESVFRHLAQREGVEHRFAIDSAGTAGYHVGDPPDARTVQTAQSRGVVVAGRARQFSSADLAAFDYVIVMDSANLSNVKRIAERGGTPARIHLLREWDPEAAGDDVPDPYYGGVRGFDDVHDIVERSCMRLLEHLLEEAEGG
ncbi:MAG TPA: low molecular weight protein-tyrosine-phosphatase [Longimicrobiaceae bacterium]|nr:low molecular weight protein-tyrosine-phosphatase [Longimicrobiaceae bacterium]